MDDEQDYVKFTLGMPLVYDEEAAVEIEALAEYISERMIDGANSDRILQSLVEAVLAIIEQNDAGRDYMH